MIQLQGVPWLYNKSYYQQMTRLGIAGFRSPKVDNGPVLFNEVKPVTNYDRYFLREFKASETGYNRSKHADGSVYDVNMGDQFLTPNGRHQLYLPYSESWYNPGIKSSVMYGKAPSVDDWAVMRGNLAAKAKTLGFDAGTFVAERRKTTEYLRKAIPQFLRSTSRVLSFIAKANKHKGNRALDSVGNEWLAARFGLTPLLFDIANAVQAYEAGIGGFRRAFSDDNKPVISSSLPSWQVPTATRTDNKSVAINPYSINGTTKCTVSEDYSVRGSAGIYQYLQTMLTFNPSLTALELVPFSFVVGWVCNIPEQLIAHAPVFDRHVEYYCLAMKSSKTFVYQASWFGNAGYKYYISGNSGLVAQGYHQVNCTQTITLTTDIYSRRRVEPTDIPWVATANFNLSALHLADLAALAKQKLNALRRI